MRDSAFLFAAVLVGFLAAIGFSVWAATTVSTSVTTGAHVYATSTVQATGSLIGYGNLLLGGTTTAAVTGVNIGGVTGTSRDAYRTGGLGIGVTTTTDGALETSGKIYVGGSNLTISGTGTSTVSGGLIVSSSGGNVGIGTSTPTVFLSVGGAAATSDGNVYLTGGLGVGVTTSTAGALETSGKAYI
ncbi:MAG TPA: hypothetical protein DCY86_00050, partial [Bdellovibrionales bacterium]|nr:hypothetical protein [Bdellovibrionales bacterium]